MRLFSDDLQSGAFAPLFFVRVKVIAHRVSVPRVSRRQGKMIDDRIPPFVGVQIGFKGAKTVVLKGIPITIFENSLQNRESDHCGIRGHRGYIVDNWERRKPAD